MSDRATSAKLVGPFVGVSAVVIRAGLVLVGRRLGSLGAGTWAFPGGKTDAGEDPVQTVRRELAEETGLEANVVEPIAWTSDVLSDDRLHFVTLHHRVIVDLGEPRVLEPDRVSEWRWVPWSRVPQPTFDPTASLLATGWQPTSGS